MKPAGKNRTPDFIKCILKKDRDTGRWIGHCLDFDIVTSGKDEDRAWSNLKAVVRLHVENCFANWQEGLDFHASQVDVDSFDEIIKREGHFRSDKIIFKLIPPQQEHAPLWIQGVELVEGADHNGAAGCDVPAIH